MLHHSLHYWLIDARGRLLRAQEAQVAIGYLLELLLRFSRALQIFRVHP